MADCVRQVYAVKVGRGEIRRVNINAAPLDHAGYATVKAAGIGTYQIFQETYHHETYAASIPPARARPIISGGWTAWPGRWRPDCDDVGIGALFGLYDWRFEVLGLVATPCTCRSTTTSGRTRSVFRGCARPAACNWTTPGWSATSSSSGWWPCCGWRCLTRD